MSPRSLAHYQLEELLGKGGMGEVYLATDTRLDRKVAVKILPQHLAGDVERRQRLEREARSISGLNHPNICTLYDVGHADGTDFLVMELLEGETLTARIARGAMPIEEFLNTAMQITEGLNAAHRAGLVHRDLKPGNIMLTKAGAKLLDFGLARTAKDQGVSNLTAAPTLTSPLTAEGTLVGTFQYLAPELLEGGSADARSDLFALGIVLYEMTTGRPAFEAKTQAGLIGAILEREPTPISSVVPNISPALENLIAACMAKDPDQRIQTAHDVLLQLRWIRDGGSAINLPTTAVRSRKRMARLAWAVAVLFALLSAGLAAQLLRHEEKIEPRLILDVPNPASIPFTGIASMFVLSPDGNQLLLPGPAGDQGTALYIQDLRNDQIRVVPGTNSTREATWSPDGQNLAFEQDSKLVRISAQGGGRQVLADFDGTGLSWSPKGSIACGNYDTRLGLVLVPETGGAAVTIVRPDSTKGLSSYIWPKFLPDGEHILFTAVGRSTADVRICSVDGKLNELLIKDAVSASYASGHILFVRERSLLAAPFDLKSHKVGEPFVVASPVWYSTFLDFGAYSVSETGVLAYLDNVEEENNLLVVRGRDGGILRSIDFPTTATDLDLSSDDRTLLMARPPAPGEMGQDVWSYDLARDIFTRISFEGADDPVWSPDGRQVVYSQRGKLALKNSSGLGEPEILVDQHDDAVTHTWSPDGEWLIYCVTDQPSEDLWAYDLKGDRGAFPILSSEYRELQGQISSDGRWMCYASNESGRLQIYVVSWPDLSQKVQISRDGGTQPRWNSNGNEVFFLNQQAELCTVQVSVQSGRLEPGQPEVLFASNMSTFSRTHEYDVSSDGQKFYMVEHTASDADTPPIRMIVNWAERK